MEFRNCVSTWENCTKLHASSTWLLVTVMAQFSPTRIEAGCCHCGNGTSPHENFAPCCVAGRFRGPFMHIAAFCAINWVMASCCVQFRHSGESNPSLTKETRYCSALTPDGLSRVLRSAPACQRNGRNWNVPSSLFTSDIEKP